MVQHGGKRKGSGRPMATATLEAQKQRELLVMWLTPHLEGIFNALKKKALNGDVAAIKELFDRAWGKAPQALVGQDGGPIEVTVIRYARHEDRAAMK